MNYSSEQVPEAAEEAGSSLPEQERASAEARYRAFRFPQTQRATRGLTS